jgi:MFS family permease
MHASKEAETFSDLTSQQKKSGLAAWLGWLFDGLDMHLYTLVAVPFVAMLLSKPQEDTDVSVKASLIQAAFLVGWAVGGAFFGRIGDLIGRSHALVLTILTYACFTGLSYFSKEWWHLLVFRFLAALGIGGEWAVGASLLTETWPKRWRPWMAAVLQSAVNCGVLLACFAGFYLAGPPYRPIFLVGILPALVTLWIRKAVPEPEVWEHAHEEQRPPGGISALFRPPILRTTLIVVTVCALGLTAHWALMFWHSAHLRALAKAANWSQSAQDQVAPKALYLLMVGSIVGNFFAGWIARHLGYARGVGIMFLLYFGFMLAAYGPVRGPESVLEFLPGIGLAQGAFALFTMCLPPLFPTLLRTTGAGFCYNIGRVIAAAGTVIFGLWATVWSGPTAVCDHRLALFYAAWLFLPAALVSWLLLPEPERDAT